MLKKIKIISLIFGAVGVCCIVAACVLMIINNKKYTISFNTDGGSIIDVQTIKKGERITRPTDPVKEENAFVRWEYQDEEYDFSTIVNQDMTLKAIWEPETKKYKVTFNVDGIEKEIETNKITDEDIENLNFEEKSGYVLKWYLSDKEYVFSSVIESDITLIGKYEKSLTFTVRFNTDGGTSVSNQVLKNGEKVKEPTNITKYGYILDGWYLNNKKFDFNTEVTTNMTLVAKWNEDPSIKRYTVTFNSDGGSNVVSQKVIENQKAYQPNNPTKSGYTFEGWFLNNSKYNFNSQVKSNITLVAKWKEIVKYTVSFDSDGGSNVSSQTVIDGQTVQKPTNPLKTGYKFKEWQLNGSAYNFNSQVKSNITLKAIWIKLEKYIVSFDSNGGSSVPSQSITEGDNAIKPTNPTKLGNVFKEWQLNGSTYSFNVPVTGNITLVAVWEDVDQQSIQTMVNNINNANLIAQTGNTNLASQIASVSGCSVTITNFPSQIERDISDKTISVNVNVVCGSASDTKTKNVTIPKSPYTYSKVMNNNMLNYDVTVNGGSWNSDGKLFLGTSGGFNVFNRKAVIEINKIESNPSLKLRFNNDSSTIYVVPFN